jgi:ribosome assembly protein 1
VLEEGKIREEKNADSEDRSRLVWQNDGSVLAGFQMATQAGPLCEEPMQGVGFIVEQWADASFRLGKTRTKNKAAEEGSDEGESESGLRREKQSGNNKGVIEHETKRISKRDDKNTEDASEEGSHADVHRKKDVYGPMSGQIMSVVKDGCRKAFQTMPQRLMQAMYECTILSTSDILGKNFPLLQFAG